MSEIFLKLTKDENLLELIKIPKAFALLTLIAYRAKREKKENEISSLEIGEAFVGDYENCGLTRREYRTALQQLEDFKLITKRATNRGTTVKLMDKRIFDINPSEGDQPKANERPTNDQPKATKKKERKKELKN